MICEKCNMTFEGNFCPNCGHAHTMTVENNTMPTRKKGNVCSVLGIIFGAISIIPLLNLVFLIPAIILTIIGAVSKNRKRGKTIASIIIVVVSLIISILWMSPALSDNNSSNSHYGSVYTEKICEENAIAYATNKIQKQLKNPDSFQLHSAKVYVSFDNETYYYYSLRFDFSAQNGFGGYNRETDYGITVKVRKSDQKAMDVSDEEYLREITKWNDENIPNN